ncbi:MAG: acyl-CoA synthetase [Gammaproteobacteria bacterium]
MTQPEHIAIHAARTPGKPACIMAGSGEIVTYADLDRRSNQCARLLRARGLRTGDHIAMFMENHPRFMEIVWGAQRAGLYFTPIASHLAAAEVAYILADSGARLLLASAARMDVARALPGHSTPVESWLCVDGAVEGFEDYCALRDAQPAAPIQDEAGGVDMLYSSGTTGRPKGVVTAQVGPRHNPPVTVKSCVEVYGMGADTIYLSTAPLYHAAPLRYTIVCGWLGATAVIMEKFDAGQALAAIERYRVTTSQWVPTMFIRLLRLAPEIRARHDLSSHRVAIHAAAPCPREVKKQMIQWWGPIIHEYYAGTESCGACRITSQEWLAHEGSVGRAATGSVHILGEDGRELGPGENGYIYFAGGPSFRYHNDPGKTARAFNERGWATLGDVGHLDAEGYLYLTDRRDFMIISGGVNIYPQEIENCLLGHPAIADAAVFGIPDADFGEAVHACVELTDPARAGPAMAQDIQEFCRARLSHVKCPRTIAFEDRLPRQDNGKLYKRLLRERYL